LKTGEEGQESRLTSAGLR